MLEKLRIENNVLVKKMYFFMVTNLVLLHFFQTDFVIIICMCKDMSDSDCFLALKKSIKAPSIFCTI